MHRLVDPLRCDRRREASTLNNHAHLVIATAKYLDRSAPVCNQSFTMFEDLAVVNSGDASIDDRSRDGKCSGDTGRWSIRILNHDGALCLRRFERVETKLGLRQRSHALGKRGIGRVRRYDLKFSFRLSRRSAVADLLEKRGSFLLEILIVRRCLNKSGSKRNRG